MSEEMRKEFEEWCKDNKYTAMYFRDGMYFDKATEMAWLSWQASREAMKPINLPELDYEWTGIADANNAAINECKEAIQQAGYKVEE